MSIIHIHLLFAWIMVWNQIQPSTPYSHFFNHWHCIGIQKYMDTTKPYKINVGELPLVVWKGNKNEWISTVNVCKHMGSALDNGKIKNGCLKCQYHGLEYSKNDRFGETLWYQGKLYWAYDPIAERPQGLSMYEDDSYVKSFLQVDMDCSLQDSAFNTMDIRHPEYVHSMGFGNNQPPKNIQHYRSDDKNKIHLDFEYTSNVIMQQLNNRIKSTQNSHVYEYPSFTHSTVSFGNNHLVIGVNFLPLEPKKTRWFVTICHNYKKMEYEKDLMKLLASTILTQDYFQMKNQYLENELKKEIMFQHVFHDEEAVVWLKEMFEINGYAYPDTKMCTELYKDYKQRLPGDHKKSI